jgi:hypothetical protein
MMNNGNYNISNGDDNNTWNPPPPTLEHVMAIQGQLFQAMVLMQQTIYGCSPRMKEPSRERGRMILRVMLAIC